MSGKDQAIDRISVWSISPQSGKQIAHESITIRIWSGVFEREKRTLKNASNSLTEPQLFPRRYWRASLSMECALNVDLFFCSIPDRSVRREPQNGREQRLRRRIGGGGGGRGGVAASAADDEPGQDLDLAPLVRALSLAGPAAAPLHLRPQVLATARPAAGGATVDRPGRPAHRRGPFFFLLAFFSSFVIVVVVVVVIFLRFLYRIDVFRFLLCRYDIRIN